jgi:RHS repeat-associated protein
MMTDTGGDQIDTTMKYLPFGECLESTGDLGTDKLFTGQRLDGTGLYYYGARYYDPLIGRFISPDPITHSEPLPKGQIIRGLTVYRTSTEYYTGQTQTPLTINPQEHNRYNYALNNPLRYTDPDGHQVAQVFYDWYIALEQLAQSLPPQYAWAVFIVSGAVYVGYEVEENTGWLSSAWGAVTGFFSDLFGGEATTGDPNQGPFKTKRDELLSQAENKDLRDIIDQLYRPGAKIGDGGTADIIRLEGTHIQKGIDRLIQLERLLMEQNINATDRSIAEGLYKGLMDALLEKGVIIVP